MIEKQYTIIASTGFARAATLLVRAACKFHAHIYLLYEEESVDLKNPPKSLIDVMSLGITPGTYIQIRAEGIDEEQALQAIEDQLGRSGFTSN
ncbi:HPr family phosphocarrier protein [Bacillus spizizenii ATCC 6633 = JCM 2499]|uniref:HPr family phosphocarrier protein n=2 Tax=Bacillus spizizenii TaxID=96241 RepID=A0A9Q4DSQ1_BACSC|nr:HPr family phosphocarrier protein [Bacillus spizizenii]KFI03599.1 phosphocarrier protein HPr [Bacillus sp. BSC154]QCJ17769.1 HPr family phosphocarrier protein [Bacillus subtilis]ADM38640.1 phosphocarrier protein HPr [Bacillus spizizenii str. W23]AJW84192.1 phosphocarrier protein HPr [Bacillus spizizenii]EFG90312.1 phosphocarrier protein HPr [Bacillus spizizenii ATCC 6633 = JCM 2499]